MERVRSMILLLGGTSEARELAQRINPLPVIYSLAGKTERPLAVPNVTLRSGGFGGIPGLISFIKHHQVTALINATHPYAAQMSAHAEAAAQECRLPFIRLLRPAWQAQAEDRWITLSEASIQKKIKKAGGPVWVTLGAQGAAPLLQLELPHPLYIRSTEKAPTGLSPSIQWIEARGPFSLAEELAFSQRHEIRILCCRNSGGNANYAKIEAARQLGLEVWMLARPKPPAAYASTIEEVLSWLAARFPGRKM